MAKKAKWTFLIFMAGDNSLSSAGDKDLYEMRMVGSTPEVNIIVEFDSAGKMGSRRIRISKDGHNEYSRKLKETDCGAPSTLVNYVLWAAKKYPAEHYVLDLWSHGSAWEPAEIDRIARSVNSPQYSPKEAVQRSSSSLGNVLFRSTLERIFSLETPTERAICVDDGSGHSLDTVELGNVIKRIVEILGQPIDLLGMDACLMSNLEVAYQVKPWARLMVGSEESEPGDGWPYDYILSKLTKNPDMSAAELAAVIVNDYIQFYKDQNFFGSITQSAFNLDKVDQVINPLNALAGVLMSTMPDSAHHMWKAQRQSANFFYKTLWDISHFCEALTMFASPEITAAAEALRTELVPGPENFMLAEAHSGSRVEKVGGLSIYLPPLVDINRFYSELEFAKQTRWPELLRAYKSA